MNCIDKQSAKTRLNQLSRESTPFILLIDYNADEIYIEELDSLRAEDIMYDFQGKTNAPNYSLNKRIELQPNPEEFSTYTKKFNKVKNALNEGETYLLNLTCKTLIKTDAGLQEIFYAASAKYKLLVNDSFVVFSPETFIEIRGNKIYTYPMKGTIDASYPDAEQVILDNEKETAEQVTVVDLLRNDLSIISSNVQVQRFRYVDKISTVGKEILQVSSEIVGELPDNFRENFGDLLFEILPAGSVSGAPKKRTIELINEIEGIERGFYTGICGIFDGESFDSCVMIRFIEKTEDGLFFRSGGGITHLSNPEDEYKEMIEKIYVPVT